MDKLDSYIEETSSGSSDNSATLLISLYLVVLAFFILLNSISEQDNNKTAKAFNSLTSVFSSESGKSKLNMKTPAMFDFNFVIASSFDRIEGSIKSSFQLDEINLQRYGNRMEAIIPINKFYSDDSLELRRKQKKLLRQVSNILKNENNGARLYLDFTIDSLSYIGEEGSDKSNIDMDRTSTVIDYLLSKGAPKELISGGIRFNNQQNITINFTIMEDGNMQRLDING